jgi:hypothetical protein
MDRPEAEIRAAQLKEDLLALPVLGNDVASRILADLPPASLRRIVNSTRVDWVNIGLYLELLSAVHAHVGEDGLQRWARAAVRRSIESSLLRPIVETASRLFGLSPAGIFKVTSQVWQQIIRGGGELTVQSGGPATCRIGLRGAPPALQQRVFLVSVAGALETAFDICKVEGQVRLVAPAAGLSAEFEATWSER